VTVRRRRALLSVMARARLACWAAALAGPLVLAACVPTREHVQRTYARALTPAPVRAAATAPQPVTRVLTLRALADADYRGHALDWRERITAQVERANAVLAADFGVRLEIESIREWDHADGSHDLGDMLDALARVDAAREVDWVVGFVGPAPEDPSSDSQDVGVASLFGRHLVLRAMQSSAEAAQFDVWYDALPEDERRTLAHERRVHMEVSVLLHEWGHTLGAADECDDKWIMRKDYSLLYSSFSPESARLVRVGLEHRDGRTAEAAERWASAWRAEALRMQGAAWECANLEQGLAAGDHALTRRIARLRRAGGGDADLRPGERGR
jgi:metallopeptidase family M12-like protein